MNRCPFCEAAVPYGRKHTCKKYLTPDGGVFVQMRRYDGKKRTEVRTTNLDRSIESYNGFVAYTRQFPHHRRRFAYGVRIYLKEK